MSTVFQLIQHSRKTVDTEYMYYSWCMTSTDIVKWRKTNYHENLEKGMIMKIWRKKKWDEIHAPCACALYRVLWTNASMSSLCLSEIQAGGEFMSWLNMLGLCLNTNVYLQCSQYLDIYWFYQVIDKRWSHEPLVFSHSVLSLQAYYIFSIDTFGYSNSGTLFWGVSKWANMLNHWRW